MHSSQTNVLIIGAGLAGLAAAARLARAGLRVTVLEKNDQPGGRCAQLIREGHRFDLGPTLYLMPEVFERTFADLGERVDHWLDLRRVDPTYTIRWDDGAQLTLTGDLPNLKAQVEAIEPGAFAGLLRYLDEGGRHYDLALSRFVGRDFDSLLSYFSLLNLPLLAALKPFVRHYANTGRFFRSPRLRAAFTFQDMYLGLSPFDAPATYSLLQYTELAGGVWFPRGGLYRVIEAMTALAERNGATVCVNAPVRQIRVDGDTVTGVELESGEELTADVVIANADLPYVYDQLLPPSAEARRLQKLNYTSSALTYYWGVQGVCDSLGAHNVYLAGDYRASFDSIFHGHTLPDAPSFYVHAPARLDPSAAPPGDDSLMVLVPVSHLDDDHPQDWRALRDRARAAVLDRLARAGLPDLAGRIKFEVAYTPCDWQSRFNLARGAAFSLSHTFGQVGYLRPRNQHARFRNLFFTGGSTHPGAGLPIVLLSARHTSARVLRWLGREVMR